MQPCSSTHLPPQPASLPKEEPPARLLCLYAKLAPVRSSCMQISGSRPLGVGDWREGYPLEVLPGFSAAPPAGAPQAAPATLPLLSVMGRRSKVADLSTQRKRIVQAHPIVPVTPLPDRDGVAGGRRFLGWATASLTTPRHATCGTGRGDREPVCRARTPSEAEAESVLVRCWRHGGSVPSRGALDCRSEPLPCSTSLFTRL